MLNPNISLHGQCILVTGAAGFIGSNLAKRLLKEYRDIHVVGVDSITDYYDVGIKHERLNQLDALAAEVPADTPRWTFVKADIADRHAVDELFAKYAPTVVVNLAAQAGVRYSITNPDAYIQSNLIGFYNILEACRHNPVEHLVYASSSSVYGSNKKIPYSTDDKVDNPVSLYAATKKSNELMAHAYSKLYDIPSTGLRFFTVYGPAGRPDMAYFGFTDKLRQGKTIQIFNYGNCKRDFTFVDDIVEGVLRVMQHAPERQSGEDGLPIPPYKVYNIGNNSPENLLDFVTILQEELIRARVLPADYDFDSHKQLVPMQPGDVPVTYADTSALERDFGFRPSTPLRQGLRQFAEWYASYYGTCNKQ
ncbi:MAG: NAD-dependent epimerase/dehydratase family protein [Bacteroidaceae bacterium]|nr:NAD-dependent epimerase/dehydratase family protein [Bacteroidaceae bacterium]